MTELIDLESAFADFEADVAEPLALSPHGQSLLFRDARTANSFTDEPVTDAQVKAIYDLVKWAPSAMNSQPLRVLLVRSPEARERLTEHMSGNNKAKTLSAPLVAILAADVDFHDEFHKTFPAVPNLRDNFADQQAREHVAGFSASVQAGYFILGVRAAGLAAGPMGGFDAAAIDADFFPDGAHRTLLVVNIGQPAPDAFRPRQPRLDYADVVTTV